MSWAARAALAGGLALYAGPAAAHLVTTGLGPLYDGVAHFVLSVDDLVAVLALALLAGLCGPKPARWALFVLPVSWLAGCLGGRLAGMPVGDLLPAVSFIVTGGLVTINAALTPVTMAALAAMIGFGHGFANGAGMPAGDASWPALLGIGAGVFVVFTLAVGIVLPLRSRVARTVVRVSGSWVAAAGILLLGWTLRRDLLLPTPG